MKLTIDTEELIQAIADRVAERLKPHLRKPQDAQEDEVIFDVSGLSEYLKVTPNWIYQQTHLKAIPHLKVNNQVRFKKSDIDKWIDSMRVPSASVSSGVLARIK